MTYVKFMIHIHIMQYGWASIFYTSRSCASHGFSECFRALLIGPMGGGHNLHIHKGRSISSAFAHSALSHESVKDYKVQSNIGKN